jgi:UDP-N-acetylmuramoyl-tripeptide--D-alanyl-D-alanine ligase
MTALWSADELRAATGGATEEAFAATGVSIDTRTLAPGDLFVALVGERGDGHDHAADAMTRGAAGVLAHKSLRGVPSLLVDDTLQGLTRLGAAGRARFGGRTTAITGSVGKTTTKEMLRAILSTQGATHAAHASYNNHWGVPLTLARLPPGAAFCVAEIGMNHAGEILPLARLARPHVAVVTAVEAVHIGHLGSVEAIADEKAAILRGLEPDGISVLPADSPHFARLRAAAGARVLTFGDSGDVGIVSAETEADAVRVVAAACGRTIRFRIGLPGRHMAMNALAAIAAAVALGVEPEAAAQALEGFGPLVGRGARRPIHAAGGPALLIDESYNASPASVRAALSVLAIQPAPRRVAVLGDMLELGEDSCAVHARLAGDVAAGADLLFACGPSMRALFDAVPHDLRGAYAENSAALAPMVAGAVAAGDAVLVKGSLGSAMQRVVAALERR